MIDSSENKPVEIFGTRMIQLSRVSAEEKLLNVEPEDEGLLDKIEAIKAISDAYVQIMATPFHREKRNEFVRKINAILSGEIQLDVDRYAILSEFNPRNERMTYELGGVEKTFYGTFFENLQKGQVLTSHAEILIVPTEMLENGISVPSPDKSKTAVIVPSFNIETTDPNNLSAEDIDKLNIYIMS